MTPALRLPVVANVGNRALDDPGAFGVEHNDALAVRDLGWLMTWVDTARRRSTRRSSPTGSPRTGASCCPARSAATARS